MGILDTILLIIAWIFTLIWMYGIRVRPVVINTALISLTILTTTIIFTVAEISKLHILWVMPLVIFISFHLYNFIMIKAPTSYIIYTIYTIMTIVGKTYISILRLGVSKERRKQMEREFEKSLANVLKISPEKLREFKAIRDLIKKEKIEK